MKPHRVPSSLPAGATAHNMAATPPVALRCPPDPTAAAALSGKLRHSLSQSQTTPASRRTNLGSLQPLTRSKAGPSRLQPFGPLDLPAGWPTGPTRSTPRERLSGLSCGRQPGLGSAFGFLDSKGGRRRRLAGDEEAATGSSSGGGGGGGAAFPCACTFSGRDSVGTGSSSGSDSSSSSSRGGGGGGKWAAAAAEFWRDASSSNTSGQQQHGQQQQRQPHPQCAAHAGPAQAHAQAAIVDMRGPLSPAVAVATSAAAAVAAVQRQLAVLALPAAGAALAEPIAQLVETSLIARTGPVQLAAVGVSVSVFNLVSKVLNFPLLNVTTSFVAEELEREKASVVRGTRDEQGQGAASASGPKSHWQQQEQQQQQKPRVRLTLPSVSVALSLGLGVGIVEALLLCFCSQPVLGLMGVSLNSAMFVPAARYLGLRALGAPAVVAALALQGVFRGLKDTRTPLFATVGGNVANVALDPLLMFGFGWGVEGAAIATVSSQYLIAGYLLWRLSKEVVLKPPRNLDGLDFGRFLRSGGLLLGRTLALLASVTLATSMAARQGALPMAAHQICTQTWLAASLLSDSIALAAQTLLASAFARQDAVRVKAVAFRSLQLAFGLGTVLALVLAFGAPYIPRAFTTDPGVAAEMARLMPFVAALQPITALAFVFDGLHYGASDFSFAAKTMILLVLPAVPIILFAPSKFGVAGVWMGLSLITAARMFVGFVRLGTKSGPWAILSEPLEPPSYPQLLSHSPSQERVAKEVEEAAPAASAGKEGSTHLSSSLPTTKPTNEAFNCPPVGGSSVWTAQPHAKEE